MEMALTMFEERHNPMAYRAAVVLTDGEPISWNRSAGLSAASWDRDDDAFVEPYRQYTAPVNSRSEAAIQTSTLTVADSLWTEDVNLWFVSFVYDRPYFEDIPKGDGYYARAETASEIEPIFVQIARSLPSAIVE